MITRHAQIHLNRLIQQYPVVTVTGPRQSGKTTLCKTLKNYSYVSLESLDQRRLAKEDPRGFISQYKGNVIIDEIQYCPELMAYIQVQVDETNGPGQFVLTGSQQFELMANLTQSLAGRTAIIQLLPFSLSELNKVNPVIDLETSLFTGFYPRIHDQKLNPTEMLSFYVTTYLERDVRDLINIRDLSQFEVFLKLCAGRSGQLLNISQLANDCGIQQNTVKQWLNVLEASYILKLVRPYYKNLSSRLVKSPKLFFIDTGLLCYLLDIKNASQVKTHPLKGSIFETFIFSELLKRQLNNIQRPSLYFLRDSKGHELDFLIDHVTTVDLIEVKSGATFNREFTKGISYFSTQNLKINSSTIIYNGPDMGLFNEIQISNWKSYFVGR